MTAISQTTELTREALRTASDGHAKTFDPLDVPARLDEFRGMNDGWLEGSGRAPGHAGLDWLSASFRRFYPGDTPLPHTYPTDEGGVRMEWSCGSDVMALEIDLDTHRGEWLWFDRDSDDEREHTLNMDASADWEWLAQEINGSPSV